ncbi:MAG: D-aminoacyl-tRNA deacylase, partial [Bacteroidales bacterium]
MRVVIQRVKKASVRIEGAVKAEIAQGLLVLVGFEEQDSAEDLEWMVRK